MATQDVVTTPPNSGGIGDSAGDPGIEDDETMEGEEGQPAQSTEEVDLSLPSSLQLKEGETKDVVVTLKGSGDGKAKLTAIQGVKLGEKKKEGKYDSYKDLKGKSAGDRFSERFFPTPKRTTPLMPS